MLTKQEIRQLGNREMTDELQRTRRELLKMQFDIRSGTSKEVHMVKNFKRYIARLETLAKEMNVLFLDLLPTRTILFPYTKEILQYLTEKKYDLHLITNGFEQTQHSKLKYSGLNVFFKEVITSEGSNSLKPNKEIFDFALQKAKALTIESIMIGDSIEVDILGAMNAGLDQVFVNHHHIFTDFNPTYIVNSLKELDEIF